MNKRQIDLLKELIIEDGYQAIRHFSHILNVSGKTISKDLDEIEKFIHSSGCKIDRKQGIGVKLNYTSSQLEYLNSLLNSIKVSDSDHDLEQRRIEILLNLLIYTNQYTNIQKLSDKYMVSRTSIVNDLNEIQHQLDKYHLKVSKTLKGTKIIGSEINIRKALVSILQEYVEINPKYITKYQDMRHKELRIGEMKVMLKERSISFFENLLNELEKKLKIVIYEPYYMNLLTHLIIMTGRIINGNYINENSALSETVIIEDHELYNSAIYIIKEIEKQFDIQTNKEESIYIYKYLISVRLGYEGHAKEDNNKSNFVHASFTNSLINIVSQMLGISYHLKISLYDRLILHIKPMLNRLKYHIHIKNPLLKDFLLEFEEQFYITKIACYLVCRKFDMKMIKDDEVAYILSYFISENERNLETMKIKTLVVCHSGYGTSQLLTTRLKNTFPNIDVVNVIPSYSVSNIDLNAIDLIISTVNLDIENPYLMTSVFLNHIDKENIKNCIELILNNKKTPHFCKEGQLVSIETAEMYKDVEEIQKLFDKKELIYLKEQIYVYVKSDLKDLVKRYTLMQDKLETYIFVIYYSNYQYLSSALRKIIE